MRRVLFLCTGNCVRSQMAEALLRYRGGERFEAFSAGSHPAGFVHPMSLQVLSELGIPTQDLRSKPWTEFRDQRFDAVITLCGSAREEVCVHWPFAEEGSLPVRAHWEFADPSQSKLLGDRERLEEFRRIRNAIRESVERLALAPNEVLKDDAAFAVLVQGIALE